MPSHYFSGPVLSWDTMLNMTKVETEPTSDADMNLFFEKGMREGGSTIINIIVKPATDI